MLFYSPVNALPKRHVDITNTTFNTCRQRRPVLRPCVLPASSFSVMGMKEKRGHLDLQSSELLGRDSGTRIKSITIFPRPYYNWKVEVRILVRQSS